MNRTVLRVGAIALILVVAVALLKRVSLPTLVRNRREAAPAEPAPPPSPRAIPRWDDEGGALPEGPVTDLPAGPTVE